MCSTITGMTDYRYRSLVIRLQLIHSHRDNLSHYHPYMIGIHKTGPFPKPKFKLKSKVHKKEHLFLIYYNILDYDFDVYRQNYLPFFIIMRLHCDI